MRSFRSENVSAFVKALLDVDLQKGKNVYNEIKEIYPIFITRDLSKAKVWIREQAKGTQRFGMTASSGAKRLRRFGVWVQQKIDASNWFLNGKEDVRSSYFLEETATEFDIQGLELDWNIVCWDGDFRYNGETFDFYSFKGTKWQKINKIEQKLYLKNSYRVLLTRARLGFIIFIPSGERTDETALPEFYDKTYDYLREIGIRELE